MTLATEYVASFEAERVWGKVCAMLHLFWRAGLGVFADGRWTQELGVRIDGYNPGPTEILDDLMDIRMAMDALRRCDVVCYTIAARRIESPRKSWFNEWGTGIADQLNAGLRTPLTERDCDRLFVVAKECLLRQIEGDGCAGCALRDA